MIEFIKSCFTSDLVDFYKLLIGLFGPLVVVGVAFALCIKLYKWYNNKTP